MKGVINIISKEDKSRKKYYEKLHGKLDRPSYLYTQRNLSKPILDVLKTLNGKRILEIGSGGGHLSSHIQKGGNLVVTIDISDTALQTAKNNYPDLNLIQMDAENLGFRDDCFDFVISIELIEHLPNLQNHFENVGRVLKNDGVYLFKTPNKWLHDLYWRFLRRKDVSEEHPSVCNIKFLKWLLVRNGFSVQFHKQDKLTEAQIAKIRKIFSKNLYKISSNIINIVIYYLPINHMPSIICSAKKIRRPVVLRKIK